MIELLGDKFRFYCRVSEVKGRKGKKKIDRGRNYMNTREFFKKKVVRIKGGLESLISSNK